VLFKNITYKIIKIKLLEGMEGTLTPKGPLFVWGTNGISGKYLWAEFLL